MKQKSLYNIVFISLLLVLLLIVSGCNNGSKDITGSVVEDNGEEITAHVSNAQVFDDDGSIACYIDSDCGDETTGDSYCFQGNKFLKKTTYKCVFPGTAQSYCNAIKKDSMVGCDRLTEQCRDGECLAISSLPCNDNDGGKQPNIPGKVVDATGNVVADECIGKSLVQEAYCQGGKGKAKTQQFECSFECRQGECITEDEKYNLK